MWAKGQLLLVNPWIYDFAAYNSWIEPLGMLTIAAAVRGSGYGVTVIDCLAPHAGMPRPHADGSGKLFKAVVEKPGVAALVPRRLGRYGLPVERFEAALAAAPAPDLVLVASGMTYWYPGVLEAIRRIRARFGGVPVALGGVYATLCPDHARQFSGADQVIAGPGVVAALRLADQVTGQDSNPDRLADPRSWPLPARDLVPRSYAAVLTSWGCPYRCTYCASHRLQPAFIRREPDGLVEEIAACTRRGVRRFVFYDDALLAGLQLAPIEEISFKSRDGTTINGFMVKPPDYREGTRYPTVLRIHGGPVSQFGCAMDLWYDPCLQVLAARGYVVLAVNPRGSSGRGEAFARSVFADWGDKDAQDVIAAVDFAIARGVADQERLGVGGWSYGGILTNHVIARDHRFKAATSGAGMSNMLAGYGTDMYLREWEEELGRPWEATAKWLKISFPFLHADRITTPTLFLCGEKDSNVPLLNSEQMYQALRSLGRDTKLVIYPGQYHIFTRPSYLQDRMKRYVAWYDEHLRPEAAARGTSQ